MGLYQTWGRSRDGQWYGSLLPEIRVPLTEQVIQPIVENGAANPAIKDGLLRWTNASADVWPSSDSLNGSSRTRPERSKSSGLVVSRPRSSSIHSSCCANNRAGQSCLNRRTRSASSIDPKASNRLVAQ